jgi:hypothetical protein
MEHLYHDKAMQTGSLLAMSFPFATYLIPIFYKCEV